MRDFKVAVKFAARKDLHHLRRYLSGRQHDNPQETIQALDVVLRETASAGYNKYYLFYLYTCFNAIFNI